MRLPIACSAPPPLSNKAFPATGLVRNALFSSLLRQLQQFILENAWPLCQLA
jgi:hypothetical protein